MNNPIEMIQPDAETQARFEKIAQGLKKRHAASRRLKTYGIIAIDRDQLSGDLADNDNQQWLYRNPADRIADCTDHPSGKTAK